MKDHAEHLHASKTDATYTLGRTSHETNRLIEQSRIYGESTRRLCKRAGISKGMRVLEIGSGAGDVALMLAECVGSIGQVVGVDVNAEILDTARQRATDAGKQNIEFVAADARTFTFSEKFDAVVGRFVLMYMADPGEAFAQLIAHLKTWWYCRVSGTGVYALSCFLTSRYAAYESAHHMDCRCV